VEVVHNFREAGATHVLVHAGIEPDELIPRLERFAAEVAPHVRS
jgi:hypothetical protein